MLIASPLMGAKYCDDSISVCLPVCISQNRMSKVHEIFRRVLTVVVARSSSDDNAIRYVLPVLWTTSCFHVIGQAKATPVGRILEVTHRGGSTGDEV